MPKDPVMQFPEGKERYVHAMFSKIARRYDLLNRLMSFRRDVAWRRLAVQHTRVARGGYALDIATGTGDLAFALARQVGPGGRVVGLDFVEPMLTIARQKASEVPEGKVCEFVQGNALALPFPDHTFDCATIGFAMRNVADIPKCFAEMKRVVKPGGRIVCLELSKPVWPIFRQFYYLYFYHLVPVVGRLVQGIAGPYTYLPHSLTNFPAQEALADIMRNVGLKNVYYTNLTGGIVALHVGES